MPPIKKNSGTPQRIKKIIKSSVILLSIYLATCLAAAILFARRDGKACLPIPIQKGKLHQDYYFEFLRWIPFAWTSWCFEEPPILIAGNQNYWEKLPGGSAGPKPLPRPGEWQLSIIQIKRGWPLFFPYFSFTTQDGLHFRIGCRWDDIDSYFVLPSFAIK
ncbi:MAG: hypothetical protein HY506_02445 [Candidatus Yanofskybacteria bacterium]|nr:hypothetical protein [Candidatus Yanofskybacteria bacterium]